MFLLGSSGQTPEFLDHDMSPSKLAQTQTTLGYLLPPRSALGFRRRRLLASPMSAILPGIYPANEQRSTMMAWKPGSSQTMCGFSSPQELGVDTFPDHYWASLIKSAAFSATAYITAVKWPLICVGRTEASTTLTLLVPYTLSSLSTTPPSSFDIIAALASG